MSQITVTDVHKHFDKVEVLQGINLHIPHGSVLALLGPSGCGKTTLLRLIAGFDAVDRGTISFDSKVVAAPKHFVPPEKRGIGYVPQEGALFPHLSVEDNIRFGLRRTGDSRQRVAEVMALTGLEGLQARYPHELSGGQQQRVALARALAPNPRLVLLDEPFNALDLDLRRSLCEDLIEVLRRTGTTAILVSHDPGEAFAVSDQLAVMLSGRIMQCARPEVVYWRPASPTVAKLTGEAVFLPGVFVRGGVSCGLGTLSLHDCVSAATGAATVMLRPEQIRWSTSEPGIPAQVTRRSFRGNYTMVRLELGDIQLNLRMSSMLAPQMGANGFITIRGGSMAYPGQAQAEPIPRF